MEALLVLFGFLIIGWLLLSPFLLFTAIGRIGDLEADVQQLKRQVAKPIPSAPQASRPATRRVSQPARKATLKEVTEPRRSSPDVKSPPATPPRSKRLREEGLRDEFFKAVEPEPRQPAPVKTPKPQPKPETTSPPSIGNTGRSDAPSNPGKGSSAKPIAKTPAAARPMTPTGPKLSGEELLAGTWLTWIGAIAVIIGAGFFFKYAIEQGWIGPTLRVAMGIMTGVGGILGGVFARKRDYVGLSEGLVSAGLGVLYFSFFAAVKIFVPPVMPLEVAFAGMVAATSAVIAFAVIYDSEVTFTLGMLGGFLVPLMLANAVGSPGMLFSYLLVLDAGVLIAATFRRWSRVNLLSAGGTILLWLWYFANVYDTTLLFPTLYWMIPFTAVFAVIGVWNHLVRRTKPQPGDFLLVFATPTLAFLTSLGLLGDTYRLLYQVPLTVTLSGIYLALGYYAYRIPGAHRSIGLAWGGIGAIFAVIAVPLQFNGHWIPVFWALQSLLMFELGGRFRLRDLQTASFCLMGVVLLHLGVYSAMTFRSPDTFATVWITRAGGLGHVIGDAATWRPLWNDRLFTYLVTSVALGLMAWRENAFASERKHLGQKEPAPSDHFDLKFICGLVLSASLLTETFDIWWHLSRVNVVIMLALAVESLLVFEIARRTRLPLIRNGAVIAVGFVLCFVLFSSAQTLANPAHLGTVWTGREFVQAADWLPLQSGRTSLSAVAVIVLGLMSWRASEVRTGRSGISPSQGLKIVCGLTLCGFVWTETYDLWWHLSGLPVTLIMLLAIESALAFELASRFRIDAVRLLSFLGMGIVVAYVAWTSLLHIAAPRAELVVWQNGFQSTREWLPLQSGRTFASALSLLILGLLHWRIGSRTLTEDKRNRELSTLGKEWLQVAFGGVLCTLVATETHDLWRHYSGIPTTLMALFVIEALVVFEVASRVRSEVFRVTARIGIGIVALFVLGISVRAIFDPAPELILWSSDIGAWGGFARTVEWEPLRSGRLFVSLVTLLVLGVLIRRENAFRLETHSAGTSTPSRFFEPVFGAVLCTILLTETFDIWRHVSSFVPSLLSALAIELAIVGVLIYAAGMFSMSGTLRERSRIPFMMSFGIQLLLFIVSLATSQSVWQEVASNAVTASWWVLPVVSPRALGFLVPAVGMVACAICDRLAGNPETPEPRTWSDPLSAPLSVLLTGMVAVTGFLGFTAELWTFGQMLDWKTATSLSLSLGWTVYAILILIVGIVIRSADLRIFSLGLFLLTTAKVFMLDIWQLDPTIRTFAFMGLGVALLLVSWLYRRHRRRINQWITDTET